MPYFKDNYSEMSYPKDKEDLKCLRNSQLGAFFALGSFFTLHRNKERAIVVMPTGSGKTAVLMMVPFMQGSKRVLVLTPSVLVRDQIAKDFEKLETLKEITVFNEEVERPKVFQLKNKLSTEQQLQEIIEYDVTVSTPNSISPVIEGVINLPDDLFDLVLVDEAHHSPAKTWNAILDHFDEAKKVLFTATPFRRDRKEIIGKIVYDYPISRAYEDEVFGKISFIPVSGQPVESNDIEVALKAQEVLLADRSAGLNHFLMVRTDSKKRAYDLAGIYKENTSLNLRRIDSDHSATYIEQTIKKLKEGGLDGIICVNMLGEGFNFPNLKIAAIHSPHKSLAATLQFIGRFARTSGEQIGEAKFIAAPSDIKIEAEKLYQEDATWQKQIIGLSEAKIEEEVKVKEDLGKFRLEQSDEDTEDVSLYSLKPYCHVKVYRVEGEFDLNPEINLVSPLEVVYKQVSDELNAAIFISEESTRPKWIEVNRFNKVVYDLFIVYFDKETSLFFVAASRKTADIYDSIVDSFCPDGAKQLSLSKINRALSGLTKAEFYNIGMRSSLAGNNTESYRIITGPNAHKALQKSYGRLFHRGHSFGSAESNGTMVTIGVSSSSKIWSNSSLQIPKLIEWCRELAKKINSNAVIVTNSELDYLQIPQEVSEIPEGVLGAVWGDKNIFLKPPLIQYRINASEDKTHQLLDMDLRINYEKTNRESIYVELVDDDGYSFPMVYKLTGSRFFEPENDSLPEPSVIRGEMKISITRYLDNELPIFFFSDFSSLHGNEYLSMAQNDYLPFDNENIIAVDWESNAVDINCEADVPKDGYINIQAYVENYLAASEREIVVCDHRKGEIADFISFSSEGPNVIIELYHCKATKGSSAGDRAVDDLYELCGQVAKSVEWTFRNTALFKQLDHRLSIGSRIVKGDNDSYKEMVDKVKASNCLYRIIMVQPGVSKENLSEKMANLLSQANSHVIGCGCLPLKIIASS